jgi:peptidoglycan/LPS O-acetylase OafA/YrhL
MKFFRLDTGSRIFGLDLLRFLAIFYVVLGHSKILLPEKYDAIIGKTILDGVAIFFVLSGFLIGRILLKQIDEGKTDLKSLIVFWKRRWIRTLPAYFIVLTILVIYTGVLKPTRLPETWYKYYFFIQNLFVTQPPFFSESWSLSIEEWFYLLIPLLLFISLYLFPKNRKNTILLFIFCSIVAVFIYRAFLYQELISIETKNIDSNLLMRVIPRLDGIMVGVLAAFISLYLKTLWNKFSTIWVFILAFVFLYLIKQFNSSNESYYYCVITPLSKSILILFTLPYLSNLDIKKNNIFTRFITFVSLTSYSLYLINRTIVIDIFFKYLLHNNLKKKHFFGEYWIIEYFSFWVISFLLAFLMYKFIEKPFLKLRKN